MKGSSTEMNTEKKILVHNEWSCKLAQTSRKILKNRTSICSRQHTSEDAAKEMNCLKMNLHSFLFKAVLFSITKMWNHHKCSAINDWLESCKYIQS